jgi:hypothetical protein
MASVPPEQMPAKPERRKVKRGKQTFAMDTSAIGKSSHPRTSRDAAKARAAESVSAEGPTAVHRPDLVRDERGTESQEGERTAPVDCGASVVKTEQPDRRLFAVANEQINHAGAAAGEHRSVQGSSAHCETPTSPQQADRRPWSDLDDGLKLVCRATEREPAAMLSVIPPCVRAHFLKYVANSTPWLTELRQLLEADPLR